MSQPQLFRSWLLRGQFSPSPWGRSMSGLLEETEVTFYRTATTYSPSGSFDGGSPGPAPYLTAMCHVEIRGGAAATRGEITGPSVGIVLPQYWVITMAVPADRTLMPLRGDRVRFTDPMGVPTDTELVSADVTEGVADHVEMATESFT